MPRVIVFGSLNMDLSIACERLPQAGETLMGYGFLTNPGGKGANQAVAAAKLGAPTTMIGAVGADGFGEQLVATLENAGVDCSEVARAEEVPTGVASIIRTNGENRIILDPGANHVIEKNAAVTALDRAAQPGDVLVTQLECPAAVTYALLRHAREQGLVTMFNPAPAQEIPADVWPSIDLVCLNETECALIAGIEPNDSASCERAMRELAVRGAHSVVVTLGEHGAMALREGRIVHIDACRVDAVDSTAAGDTFVGALAAASVENMPFEDALQLATCAAALTVTKTGAQQAIPTRTEVEQFLKQR